jgi:hypothetical protein
LDLAGEFFILALRNQIEVVVALAGGLFDGALRRLQIAVDFVLRALFRLVSPWLPLMLRNS